MEPYFDLIIALEKDLTSLAESGLNSPKTQTRCLQWTITRLLFDLFDRFKTLR